MTYIMITEKCNMLCDHCCNNSGPNGEHMKMEMFKEALKFAEYYGSYDLALGGGEPTLHPQFWEILGLSLGSDAYDPDMKIFIATNGSTNISIKLAGLARNGVIYAALSLDEHHDPVGEEVKRAFGLYEKRKAPGYMHSHHRNENDCREIRDVGGNEVLVGRAEENGIGSKTKEEHCVCETIVIGVHGELWACGCREFSMGTIWEPNIPEWYDDLDEKCSNGEEFKERLEGNESIDD